MSYTLHMVAQESMMRFQELTTKKARKAFIRRMLETNQAWAIRGLLRIYENQTRDEQASQTTRHWNNIGFTGADAEILSSFAEQIQGNRFAGSKKQIAVLHRRMPKYAGQLERMAK